MAYNTVSHLATCPLMSSLQWHTRVGQLALPIIFCNISVPLVGAVDTAVVGHLDEVELIGAVALGASIFSLIFWTFGFLRMATSGIVAQELGSSDTAGRSRSGVAAMTYWRSVIVALLISAAVILLQKPLLSLCLWLLNTGDALNQPTSQYFQVRVWSAPATLMNYVVLGVLIGLQRMRAVLAFQLFLNILNIVLDLLFVTKLHWGIAGVAGASLISEYAALGLGLYLLRNEIRGNSAGVDRQSLVEKCGFMRLFQLNVNIFIRTLLLVSSFFFFNARSAALGPVALAANAILLQLLHISAYALDGFAHAVETLSGHAWGSRKKQHFAQAIKYSTIQSTIVAAAMSLLIALFGPAAIEMFTNQTPVIELANELLPWMIALPLISVWCYQLDGIFIGTTHAPEMRNAMILSVVLFVCLAQWLIPIMGNNGLWLSFCIFMLARAATLLLYIPGILNSSHFQQQTT